MVAVIIRLVALVCFLVAVIISACFRLFACHDLMLFDAFGFCCLLSVSYVGYCYCLLLFLLELLVVRPSLFSACYCWLLLLLVIVILGLFVALIIIVIVLLVLLFVGCLSHKVMILVCCTKGNMYGNSCCNCYCDKEPPRDSLMNKNMAAILAKANCVVLQSS